jgi:hypothetical protein
MPGMSDFIPVNDLDRAIMALRKSKAATPDFYRHLCEGELWFPIKYHPELEDGGGFSIENGSPAPFAMLDDGNGHTYVPLFSSDARLDESLQKGNVPEKTFIAAAMPAKQILEILGKMGLHAHVNKACATGSMLIPPDLMRDLASGKAFESPPMHSGHAKERRSWIVRPENYPTELVQAAFEFLRQHRQFRVVFLFTDTPHPPPTDKPKYCFAVHMAPEDDVLFHDLNLAIAAGNQNKFEFELSPTDTATVGQMFQIGVPFYTAPDYQPPATAKPSDFA